MPPTHPRRDRQAGRNSVVPALGFSLLALLGALMPQVVFAADPVVGTQRNGVVVFIVVVLLVGSVAAGLFFASPLRKRLVPAREPLDELHPLRDGEVPAGMTHAWPAPGRSAPSYAQPAVPQPQRMADDPQRPTYEPSSSSYEPSPATYQRPTNYQPTAPLPQPTTAPLPLPTTQLSQPTARSPWPAPQPTPLPPPAQPVERVEQRPAMPIQPQPPVRPRPEIAPWSTGAPTTNPNWPRKPS